MIWKILRPQYWILDRKVRATHPLIVIGLILLLLWGGQWLYNNQIRDNLTLLNSPQMLTIIASYLPMALMFFLVFAMLGVGDVIHQLYLASDLEILMVAPIPQRMVFLVKLLQCSRATLIPAIATCGFLLALGLARHAPVGYYPLVALLILAAMTLVTAVVMILVILLSRILPAQKVRSWMPLLIALVMFILLLVQQPVTAWLFEQSALITFLSNALLSLTQLSLVVAVLAGLAFGTGLVAYQFFRSSFYEGWDRFHEVATQPKRDSLSTKRSRGLNRFVRPLPAPLRFIFSKEWLEIRRNPRGILNLIQPLILVVSLVIAPALVIGNRVEVMRPFLFLLTLTSATFFLSLMPIGTSLMSIAQEGNNIELLRSAPISMSEVLKGKFWATWLPITASWVFVFVAAGLWLRFPIWQIGFLVGVTIWGLTGTSLVTTALGGLKINFGIDELKNRIPTTTLYLTIGLNSIFVLLTIVGSIWLITRLYPDSLIVNAIQGLSGYRAVRWIVSTNLEAPLAIASLQLAFFVGAKLLWNVAVQRLEGWEPG